MRESLEKLQLKLMRYKRIRLARRVRRLKVISRKPVMVPVATFVVLLMVAIASFILVSKNDAPVSTLR